MLVRRLRSCGAGREAACAVPRPPARRARLPRRPMARERSIAPARHASCSGQPRHRCLAASTPAGVSANQSSGSPSWHGTVHTEVGVSGSEGERSACGSPRRAGPRSSAWRSLRVTSWCGGRDKRKGHGSEVFGSVAWSQPSACLHRWTPGVRTAEDGAGALRAHVSRGPGGGSSGRRRGRSASSWSRSFSATSFRTGRASLLR